MNRLMILAFSLAISSALFAAEEPVIATDFIESSDQNRTTKQKTKATKTQIAKSFLHKYLVRKDNKKTALNCAKKASAAIYLIFLLFMDKQTIESIRNEMRNPDYQMFNNYEKKITFLLLIQPLKLWTFNELSNY
ncbi:hypothetical protein JKY79_02565 [Candidatus Babeliales bacterium]|nr:hypothetical protein [Candidatus Babeliales bacterium]